MAARQYYYSEDNSPSNTTSVSYVNKLDLTFTPDANASYLLLATSNLNSNVITDDSMARLFHDTASAVLAEYDVEFNTEGSVIEHFFTMDKYDAPGSPASQTFSIEFSVEAATNTLTIDDARLLALKLGADDVFAKTDGEATNATATYQTAVTLAWTPPSAGDYLIIATAELSSAAGTSSQIGVRLFDGTTEYGPLASINNREVSNWHTWSHFAKVTGLSGAQSWTVQFRTTDAGSTTTIRRARLVALRLAAFDANHHAEQRATPQSTTSASLVAAHSLTATPGNFAHLVLSTCWQETATTGQSHNAQLTKSDVAIGNVSNIRPRNAGNEQSYTTFLVETLAASSTTWALKHSTTGGATSTLDDLAIILVQLEAAATTETLVPTGDVGTPVNATGTFANVDEGIASADGSFVAPTDSSLAMTKRFSFPALTAGRSVLAGAGLCKVRLWVDKVAGAGTTTVTATIHEAGSGTVLATPISAVSVTNETGELLEGTFDGSVLADSSAADIEVEVVTTPGSP